MKHGIFILLVIVTTSLSSSAINASEAQTQSTASSRSEMKESISHASAPEWYADNEWNVGLWASYASTRADYPSAGNSIFVRGASSTDRYIAADHAWGGGIDVKRFFGRYFGLGVEGYGVEASRTVVDAEGPFGIFYGGTVRTHKDFRAIGSALGVFTLRYPLAHSRLAPYLCFGGGAIFGGGERDRFIATSNGAVGSVFITTKHTGSRTEPVAQLGAGLEVRLTPRIGLINDFSWNIINGPRNNFGMVRSGINFAF
jgi:hypothetical protein